jgi:hypothetical protein
VGLGPAWDTYDSAKGEIFVALSDDTVSVVSDKSNSLVGGLTSQATGPLIYDPARGVIFVSAAQGNTVAVLSDVIVPPTTSSSASNATSSASTSSTAPEFPAASLALVSLVIMAAVAFISKRLQSSQAPSGRWHLR